MPRNLPLQPLKWTDGCAADILLDELLDGTVKMGKRSVTGDEKPSEIFDFFPQFHNHFSSAVFRKHWNDKKHERGRENCKYINVMNYPGLQNSC